MVSSTAMGSGTIQLVSPHLVNWIGLDCPSAGCSLRSETTAGIAILRLQFVPEPSSGLLLIGGIGLLGVLYRWRRQSSRGPPTRVEKAKRPESWGLRALRFW